MRDMVVVVANEPRMYRQVVAAALPRLRPGMRVVEVEPDDLDREIVALEPNLVICSRLTEAVETRAPAWILLYPEAERRAVISLDGTRVERDDIDLDAFVDVVDRAHRLVRPE